MAQKPGRIAATTVSLALAFLAGYSFHSCRHQGWISSDKYWSDAGEQAGRYALLQGQCEAARSAYLRERQDMLNVLRADAARYRVNIQDNIGGLLFKLRIVGCHIAIQPVRLQSHLRPHPMHGGLAQSQRRRHLAARPMRRPVSGLLLRLARDASLQRRICDARLAAFVAWVPTRPCPAAQSVVSSAKSSGLWSAMSP